MTAGGVKTSVTHPLQIKVVTPPGFEGAIGMTLCPGRQGPALPNGTWHRDLGVDLAVVRAWKPDIVLALLEDDEFARLGLPNFRRAVRDAGLPWEFLPIEDAGIPDEAFALRWKHVGPRVRSILRGGGRVLVHCRAGLGRTGTIAAALLVELGSEPDAAIRAVRAARPHAIETSEQETYVRTHLRDLR